MHSCRHRPIMTRTPHRHPRAARYTESALMCCSDRLDMEKFETGKIHTGWINILQNGLGEWVKIPFILARGASVRQYAATKCNQPTPTNELRVYVSIARSGSRHHCRCARQRAQRRSLHPSLDGQHSRIEIERQRYGNSTNLALHAYVRKTYASLTLANPSPVVAVPCVNITGYLSYRRQFRDGHDLNRTFPGKPGGFASQVFCHQLLEKLIRHFNYHIDLHTASFGRINSYYIRADMLDPVTAEMSLLCNPQIILHNSGQDGTLRGAATQLGIKSITVEIGNPQSLQSRFISWYVPALAALCRATPKPNCLLTRTTGLRVGPTPALAASCRTSTCTRCKTSPSQRSLPTSRTSSSARMASGCTRTTEACLKVRAGALGASKLVQAAHFQRHQSTRPSTPSCKRAI